MRWGLILIAGFALVSGTLAGLVFANFGDTQTASGGVNVTTTSADLYICEPGGTIGPDCGADDSEADEIIFETIEDLLPLESASWDIRLKNVGSEPWIVSSAGARKVETVDLGDDCSDNLLRFLGQQGVLILGKEGDTVNDNPIESGFTRFGRIDDPGGGSESYVNIKVAPADYEDIRLQVFLPGGPDTEGCDDNEWNVFWEFSVFSVR